MNNRVLNGNVCLPQIPETVGTVKNCSELLTDRNESNWKFLFEEIKDIPNAFTDNQDYDFGKIDERKWQSVIVPSSLIMQGFDIENNIEYYHKRTVRIPKDFQNNCVYLRFEGVYSNARVWINNKFCAAHIGGFTVWDIDITEFANCDEITIVVGVADIEGSEKSVWNTDGKYQSNSAWASYYAHHNIGGIIRDITMFCLPKQAILQTHIDTFLNGTTATAKVNMCFSKACIGLTLRADIVRNGEIKASRKININSQSISFELDVLCADLWDAEHPNLHTLKTVLYDASSNVLQENSMKFGFREITYGGQNGTDKNKIYVNGKEIKLRGVCRHDVSRLYGRSLTKEDIYNEIKTYKEHNINHIRTSHYPVSDYMLSVCDELGMYAEQENAACFKGENGFDIYNPPVDFLNSFKEMVEYSRNHPSVIIWSIANESGFEKSKGFRDCYNYIKQTDLTRPVIFSYPYTVHSKPLPYDIYSKHYAKVTSDLGRKDMPILHDEFAHVPCYNLDDLTTDNSCRVFWGESIKRGWDNIFDTEGALGCDIWAAIDDVFYLPEKRQEKHQNHLKGECAGYGEWGCIFDPFKRLKPEAYLTKKAFTPIKIKDTSVCGNQIKLQIQNRFDHTDLNEVTVTVQDKNANVLFSGKMKESIAPHNSGTVTLSPVNCTDNMTVLFAFDGVTVESTVIHKINDEIPLCRSPLHCEFTENGITVNCKDTPVAFVTGMDLKVGKINDTTVKSSTLKKITKHTYAANFGFGKSFLLTIRENRGDLQFEIKPRGLISAFCKTGELGVTITLPNAVKSVSWRRNALYNDYPKGHIARDSGTAFKIGAAHRYSDTDMGEISWEQDMSAFAYYDKASEYNTLASNDFKTKRLNIRNYQVTAENGKSLLIHTDCAHINAYANPFREKLQISKGDYMPSIAWGNYWGNRFRLNRKNPFVFSVSFAEENEER
ncbi:MAG: glycoside hydrolase family 2 TIM barrel-domain containing protein [Clostridia bacterium]|nr:glycoside hydrolase family 2 TIM barrel-domain containing protein [Clostridia bacterium]